MTSSPVKINGAAQVLGFVIYEFVGTMVLTIIFNILAVVTPISPDTADKLKYLDVGANSTNFAFALFVVTFICWDVAPAQFNSALAVGQMLYEAQRYSY